MTRHQPVNAALHDALTDMGAPPALVQGVYVALGTYAMEPDPVNFPVLGFYVAATNPQFLLYAITPGRFIRYEVAGSESLTIAVPAHKISRVVESTGPGRLGLLIELDADTTTTVLEYRERADDTDPAVLVGRSQSKTARTFYELTATTTEEAAQLMPFSMALRSGLGA